MYVCVSENLSNWSHTIGAVTLQFYDEKDPLTPQDVAQSFLQNSSVYLFCFSTRDQIDKTPQGPHW